MEDIEFEKDLIAVLLVVESVHDKNKLLYKYDKSRTIGKRIEPTGFYSPYAIVIAKDFDPPSAKDDEAPRTTFRNFDETTLSILTTPNSVGTHVEVQVDDVVFVGHTLGLENNNNLKSFAIFFALRATTKATVILSYQEMSKRIGTAIRCEEQRESYLTNEYAKLIAVLQQHDVEPTDPLGRVPVEDDKIKIREEKDRHKEELYADMAKQSVLAATLKQIYISLQSSGEINIIINNWLNVSCCLPHRSITVNCPLSIDYAVQILNDSEQYFKPYYGILLVIDPSILLNSLPADSSSTLNTLVRHLRSSHSMSRLSLETGVPLSQIYRLASHLLYWGRAKIIYPINDENIYIISPDVDISKQGALSKLYHDTFENTSNYSTLQEALAEYSDAVTFYDHLPSNDDIELVKDRLQFVEWLLRHRVLLQVHYYYYVVLPNDYRNNFKDEYKKARLPASRTPFRRSQYSTDSLGSSTKTERVFMTSENIDIRGNVLSINGFEYNMASSPANNTFSYSSTQNSKSTDALRGAMANSQDDVFASGSLMNTTTTTNNQPYSLLRYLPLIEKTLHNEKPEYRELLAYAIHEYKESNVIDFLKIFKYLNGNYHLDEIASLENISRLQVLMIIENFRTLVVRALHQDPNPVLQI